MTTRTEHFEFREQLAHAAAVIDAGLDSKAKLLSHLARALSFPDYFGENWDALVDCLSDLEWIDAPEVVVAHRALPALPPRELRVYLECLADSLARRERAPRPRLRVQFRAEDQAAVEAALLGGT